MTPMEGIYDCHTYYKDMTHFKDIKILSENYIKIIHTNIRSLTKNFDAINALLDSLEIKFTVIVLSELWTTNLSMFNNALPGYNLIESLCWKSIETSRDIILTGLLPLQSGSPEKMGV